MRPFVDANSVVMIGRPASSTHAWLHAARSSGVRSSRIAIRSGHVALREAVRRRYSRSPSRNAVSPDDRLELAHDDRRLLVDDRAVERPGFAQVRERLADRVRARRAVHS